MVVAVIWIVDVGVDAALEDRLVVEWFDGGFVCCAGEVDVLAVFVSFALLFVYTVPPVIEECREWSLQRRYMPKIKKPTHSVTESASRATPRSVSFSTSLAPTLPRAVSIPVCSAPARLS